MAQNEESYSGSESAGSVDENEVERILRERKLQRQAQQELDEERKQEVLTTGEIKQVVDQADQIQSKVDDTELGRKELKRMITTLDSLFAANQEKRDQYPEEPLKFMESEEALADHLHEVQGITAYPERLDDCIAEGLIESVLAVVMHPNLDISSLCITLLYELCESELASSHSEVVKKVIQRFSENSIWSLLIKVMQAAREEKKQKGLMAVSERSEQDILEQKCLSLLQNTLEIEPEILSAKMMHSDAFIEYMFETLEQRHSQTTFGRVSYSQVLCSDILTQVVQNCGNAFRSKFVITMQGMLRLLTLVDSQIEQGEPLVDTTLELVQNLMDALAMLLVDDQIKENAGVFQEARGYQMMLEMIVTRPELRRESLKVVSIGLTKCTIEQAVAFVDQTRGLSILFGLWNKQPELAGQISKEHSQLHEYFLAVFWNLISALSASTADPKTKVSLERLCLKFVDSQLGKLIKLVQLHSALFSRLADFDLAEFTQMAEIKQLEDHFNLDLLIIVDCILGSLCVTDRLDKVFESQNLPKSFIFDFTVKLSGCGKADELAEQMSSVLRLQILRCEETDKAQASTIKGLIESIAQAVQE